MRDIIILFLLITAVALMIELYAFFTAKKSYTIGYEKGFNDCIEGIKELAKERKKENKE